MTGIGVWSGIPQPAFVFRKIGPLSETILKVIWCGEDDSTAPMRPQTTTFCRAIMATFMPSASITLGRAFVVQSLRLGGPEDLEYTATSQTWEGGLVVALVGAAVIV